MARIYLVSLSVISLFFIIISAHAEREYFFDFESSREEGLPEGFYLADGFFIPDRDAAEWNPEVYSFQGNALVFRNLTNPTYTRYGYSPLSTPVDFPGSSLDLSFRMKADFSFQADHMNAVLHFYGDDSSPVQTQEIGFRNNEVFLPSGAVGVAVTPSIGDAEDSWKRVSAHVQIDRSLLPDVRRVAVEFTPNLLGPENEDGRVLFIDDVRIVVL